MVISSSSDRFKNKNMVLPQEQFISNSSFGAWTIRPTGMASPHMKIYFLEQDRFMSTTMTCAGRGLL
jgi:hypothetical protein